MPGQQQLPTLSPVSRAWSEIWRLAIAVIVGAVAWAGSLALALEAGEEPLAWLVVLDVFAGLVSTVLVAFRHRAPLLIAVLTSILVGFSAASLGAWLLAVVSMATRRRLPDIGVAFAATVASGSAATMIFDLSQGKPVDWVYFPVLALIAAIPFVVGYARGARRAELDGLRREAALLRDEQAQIAEQARLAERARIAAEMHDALGHHLSVIAVQAAALKLHPDLPEPVRLESVSAIRTAAQQALAELRYTLGMLAEDSSDPEPSPQLSERIADLIEQVRQAGSPVDADLDHAHLGELPAELSRPVYRIVQECLTNAMRHAPGIPVRLTIDAQPGQAVRIRVANATATPPPPSPGSGLGLVGIAERVRLAHGELQVRPTDEEFTVEARLPWLR